MGKLEALDNGMIYTGWIGVARIYCSSPNDIGGPAVSARGFVSEILLDIQEGLLIFLGMLNFRVTDTCIRLTGRIDGDPMAENEADL